MRRLSCGWGQYGPSVTPGFIIIGLPSCKGCVVKTNSGGAGGTTFFYCKFKDIVWLSGLHLFEYHLHPLTNWHYISHHPVIKCNMKWFTEEKRCVCVYVCELLPLFKGLIIPQSCGNIHDEAPRYSCTEDWIDKKEINCPDCMRPPSCPTACHMD